MRLGPHTVTILRAGVRTSDYGTNDEQDWATATSTTVAGCSVQPARSEEFTTDREAYTTRMTAFLPPSADVRADDRLEWDGETYEVEGDPLPWSYPPLSHLVVSLRRSEDT